MKLFKNGVDWKREDWPLILLLGWLILIGGGAAIRLTVEMWVPILRWFF